MNSIAFEKHTLSNGLDVILHQDRSLPVVAVNLWYHVGSKDEEPGKTGFAHLFEHLMFEGSKHHNSSFFEPLQKVGANLNGSTSTDRTNYWENLPSNYLELALWLESDRMGYLLDALDQKRFDVQRDVVKNERRQSYENRPYGMAMFKLVEATYPAPHPYHWPTIGSQEDLDAAALEDAHSFFRRYYAPSNASLAIAGDFDPEAAMGMVERYFADIPPGPALPRAGRVDSGLGGRVSLAMHDKVMLPRLYVVWPTVPRFDEDEPALSILAAVLSDGKSSRLHRALVYEQQVAQSAGAHHDGSEIAGDFSIDVTAAAGRTVEEIEAAARAELEGLRRAPPTAEEVARARNRIEWSHIRRLQTVGGFGGKADRLNSYNVFRGDPGAINTDMERYLAVEPEDVQRVANEYLGDRSVRLVVLPERELSATKVAETDRSVQPAAARAPTFAPPAIQRHTLGNGLKVVVQEKRGLPVVFFGLTLKAGGAADPPGLPGLASFTTTMLQEGTSTRTSQQIAGEFEFIGSHLSPVTGRERVLLAAETMTRHWPTALGLVADVARNATFPEREVTRVRRERLTALQRLRDDPTALAERVAPMLLYGGESPYGHSLSGTEAALEALTRDDIIGHFEGSYGPEDATLIVVGDTSMEEVAERAEEWFGGWEGRGPRGKTGDGESAGAAPETTAIFLLDKPGAAQSVVRAGHLTVPRHHPDYYALTVLNAVFGGQFTARLNMNLRQDKGYSYGFHSRIEWNPESSLAMAGGGVQTAVTKESVAETLREFEEIRRARPVTEEEFTAAKDSLLQHFPSSFETAHQILEHLLELVSFDLPDDYFQKLPGNLEAVTLDDVRRVARQRVAVEHLALLVVGDAEVVEPGLRELGLPLYRVDHEGRVDKEG